MKLCLCWICRMKIAKYLCNMRQETMHFRRIRRIKFIFQEVGTVWKYSCNKNSERNCMTMWMKLLVGNCAYSSKRSWGTVCFFWARPIYTQNYHANVPSTNNWLVNFGTDQQVFVVVNGVAPAYGSAILPIEAVQSLWYVHPGQPGTLSAQAESDFVIHVELTVYQLRPDRAGGDSGPSPAPAPPPLPHS
jgi:hypothetical protein